MKKDPLNTSDAIFQEVWTVIDERYPFFELKKVDWNESYVRYQSRVAKSSGDQELFQVLGDMIVELKDSHTDIHSKFNSRHYWPIHEISMHLFNIGTVQRNYLYGNFQIQNAICYGFIGETGYVYIENFSEEISQDLADQIFNKFDTTESIIFDVRNNTGGNENYGNLLISYLLEMRLYHKIIYFKKDKAHDSFASGEFYIEPNDKTPYEGKIIVLTNRACYSATNSFVGTLSQLPQTTIIGDTTGGGGSTPYYYELQNGWILRYSSSKEARYSDGWLYEKGIPPDFYLEQKFNNESDNVLDFALVYLNK